MNGRQLRTLAIALALGWAGSARALDLPATGQTTAYTANKNDGTVRAGAPLSFTDNGNGTITDNNTGLTWEKKGDNGGLHDKDNSYWWTGNGDQETVWDWLEDVNAAAFGGHQDWRIPNARELLSIADFQSQWAVPAAFNNNCVPNVTVLTGSCSFQSLYWTSTTRWGFSSAWGVDNYGSVYPYSKPSNFRIRAVRGGTQ